MEPNDYGMLRLERQLCFPLYACSKEVIRRYKPFLDPLELTYTQYIALMVLWEKKSMTVKDLGERLYLDSGTLTPVLKKLEAKHYIQRQRSEQDERSVIITLTEEGWALQEKASAVPKQMSACVVLSQEERIQLYGLLQKMLASLR